MERDHNIEAPLPQHAVDATLQPSLLGHKRMDPNCKRAKYSRVAERIRGAAISGRLAVESRVHHHPRTLTQTPFTHERAQ